MADISPVPAMTPLVYSMKTPARDVPGFPYSMVLPAGQLVQVLARVTRSGSSVDAHACLIGGLRRCHWAQPSVRGIQGLLSSPCGHIRSVRGWGFVYSRQPTQPSPKTCLWSLLIRARPGDHNDNHDNNDCQRSGTNPGVHVTSANDPNRLGSTSCRRNVRRPTSITVI